MRHTLAFTIDTDDEDVSTLRDQIARELTDDLGITVVSASSARDQQTFIVTGVNVDTREPFVEHIDADDIDDARTQIETDSLIVSGIATT